MHDSIEVYKSCNIRFYLTVCVQPLTLSQSLDLALLWSLLTIHVCHLSNGVTSVQ